MVKKLTLALLILVMPTQLVRADTYLGTFPGNDLPGIVDTLLGIDATLLGSTEVPGVDNDFAVGGSLFTPDGWVTGGWYYPGQVNLITIKAGNEWAAFCVRDPCETIEFSKRHFLASSFTSSGAWSTEMLGWKGVSHVSAWSVLCVPEPSTFILVLVGMVLIGLVVVLAHKEKV